VPLTCKRPGRDSTRQEFAIQVGTPSRGSTQRMSTKYAARKSTGHNHSATLSPLYPLDTVSRKPGSVGARVSHTSTPAFAVRCSRTEEQTTSHSSKTVSSAIEQ
jgi:hypothetical protein